MCKIFDSFKKAGSCSELSEMIQQIGFLPLLDSGIIGYSAEAIVYGKFFAGKAGFISMKWWPDFCNYRRHKRPAPSEGSIEEAILQTLHEQGSMITRELRAACGFTGPKMRSRFDGYITRLQMACRIVTEDFIYPLDKHNHEYGWGWALLTIPENLLGKEACRCPRTPQESFERIFTHFSTMLPQATEKQIMKLLQ